MQTLKRTNVSGGVASARATNKLHASYGAGHRSAHPRPRGISSRHNVASPPIEATLPSRHMSDRTMTPFCIVVRASDGEERRGGWLEPLGRIAGPPRRSNNLGRRSLPAASTILVKFLNCHPSSIAIGGVGARGGAVIMFAASGLRPFAGLPSARPPIGGHGGT